MNKSQKIRISPETLKDNKYLYVKLEQDVDTLEIMSLKVDTKDAYQDFNANYGVLVGRVNANNGISVPNAKISIFIPLNEEDENNSDIVSIYPFKKPTDKNNEGKRYNLLPRVGEFNPIANDIKPQQPFGSFPTKEEIITNPTYLEVFEKYYKYTTVTNSAGDYMIFGVPVGTQTVHMSVDITDIGKNSMTPEAMVKDLGYSPNLFTNDNTRIKESDDLDDLPHIETQEISVDVIPFWGDSENFDIGITKVDFRIRAALENVFYVFGSVFTDSEQTTWGKDNVINEIRDFYTGNDEILGMYSKRAGNVKERIYYYPPEVTDEEIENADPSEEEILERKMKLLDPSEYVSYKRGGDFVFIIKCNRGRITTDEFGNEFTGAFTTFRGFITLEITDNELSLPPRNYFPNIGYNKPYRVRLKFPQYGDDGKYFSLNRGTQNRIWRKQHKIFEAGKFYSVSKFHGTVFNNDSGINVDQDGNGFFEEDVINDPLNQSPYNNVGAIATNDYTNNGFQVTGNEQYDFPSNSETSGGTKLFGANWMNLSVHFPQLMHIQTTILNNIFTTDFFHDQEFDQPQENYYYLRDNKQLIAANKKNTIYFARNDLHWTDIIEVPENDIRKMFEVPRKGFSNINFVDPLDGIENNLYHNGDPDKIPTDWGIDKPCPYNGGKKDGDPNSSEADTKYYFYKGFNDSDCISYLFELGLIEQ
jgi:hypothetical protein